MRIAGRRLARNSRWRSIDVASVWITLALVLLDAALTVREFPVWLLLAVVLHALWCGLPADAPPLPPAPLPPTESAGYREPLVRPQPPDSRTDSSMQAAASSDGSLIYMRVIMYSFVGIHLVVISGAVLVFGFISAVCSRH